MRSAALLLLLAALPATGTEFRFERSLTPPGSGPAWAAVDAELLAGAALSELPDLRLFSADGREVPYLLIAPATAQPRMISGQLLPVAATKERSGFEVDLGAVYRVDRLHLMGFPAPFLKRFRLEGSGDRQRWTLLIAEGTLFDLPAEQLVRTAMDFRASELRYLRLEWDDRTSGRVPLPSAAEARLPGLAEPAERQRQELTWGRRPSEPGKSRFRVLLPGPHLPVTHLELEVGGGHLLRPARVSEARLGSGEVVPMPLGEAKLRRVDLAGARAEELSIPIRRPAGAELELVVEDGDNPALLLERVIAVFSPLPWMYFESPDGAPVVARYGAAGLAAPRYDLEALRGRVDRSTLNQARWGSSSLRPEVPSAAAIPVELTGAPLATAGFRYRRQVAAKEPGLTALALDAAVLAHSRDLRDLRLVDGEGRQVPYLLERRDEPLVAELSLRPDPKSSNDDGVSAYRATLPFAGLPASLLELRTGARVFRREVKVYEVGQEGRSGRAAEPPLLAASSWRHADPETAAPALSLALPALAGGELSIAVLDGENGPLPLAPPQLLLPSYRLRFHGGRELTLVYGDPRLETPRYDLELLAPRLVGAAAFEIKAGPEEATGAQGGERGRWVFWGALVAVVLLLLGLLARLLAGRHEA